MHNGDLASIHSSLQQAFLTAEAAKFADEVNHLIIYRFIILLIFNDLLRGFCNNGFLGMELLDWIQRNTSMEYIRLVR